MSKSDHTDEIFEKLGVTLKTNHELFQNVCKAPGRIFFLPYAELRDGTLEADGLAWKLLDLLPGEMCYEIKTLNWSGAPCLELFIFETYTEDCDAIVQKQLTGHNKAEVVHDALVEALGITEDVEK